MSNRIVRVSSESAEVRAARGAAWLDRKHHGWWNQVALDLLDMGDGRCCVAGQLEGYLSGSGYGAFVVRFEMWSEAEVALGFAGRSTLEVSYKHDCLDLRDAWIAEILRRLSSPPKRPRFWWLTKFTHRDRDAVIW